MESIKILVPKQVVEQGQLKETIFGIEYPMKAKPR